MVLLTFEYPENHDPVFLVPSADLEKLHLCAAQGRVCEKAWRGRVAAEMKRLGRSRGRTPPGGRRRWPMGEVQRFHHEKKQDPRREMAETDGPTDQK